MFRGRFEHTIDSKGRISLPAKFREVLKGRDDSRLVITNFDGCLVAYPFSEWQLLEEKWSSISLVKREVTAFLRFFISGATECSIDKLGRIMIPPTLRNYALLEKDIVFAGMLKRFEIWSKEKWEDVVKKSLENFDEISDTLSELGL
jgi:MraZ protein